MGDRACAHADGGLAQHRACIPVSVNISARQLQQSTFPNRRRAILAAHPGAWAGDLELEVLETSALEDLIGVSRVMKACRELGVEFALDDFGTGYSSLTYLKRLPVSLLKIDQSFVRDMLDDPDDQRHSRRRHQPGFVVPSSGHRRRVETVEHGKMLLQLGCELAQGYGIARPMPASDLPNWVAAGDPMPTGATWRRSIATTTLALRCNRASRLDCRHGRAPQRCAQRATGHRSASLPLWSVA